MCQNIVVTAKINFILNVDVESGCHNKVTKKILTFSFMKLANSICKKFLLLHSPTVNK